LSALDTGNVHHWSEKQFIKTNMYTRTATGNDRELSVQKSLVQICVRPDTLISTYRVNDRIIVQETKTNKKK
jgi:hypothetical protein